MDHLGAPLTLGFGLARNGADHLLGQVDVLDLDRLHFDSPGLRLLVERSLNTRVQLLPLTEQLIKIRLAQNRPQPRLRELRCRVNVMRDLDDGLGRVEHAEEDHRAHLDRDVVARHDVLRRHIHRLDAQRDAHDPVDRREHQHQAGPLRAREQAPQTKDDAALVLRQNLDAVDQIQNDDEEKQPVHIEESHRCPPRFACRSGRDVGARHAVPAFPCSTGY